MGAGPPDRRFADRNWRGFAGWLDLQFELHAGKGSDHALDSTAFLREILYRSRVPQLVSLDESAWNHDGESGVLADNHVTSSLSVANRLGREHCPQL
jgi:hypothetical protein